MKLYFTAMIYAHTFVGVFAILFFLLTFHLNFAIIATVNLLSIIYSKNILKELKVE